MSNYYANSQPINNDFYRHSENSQSPRFSLAFQINKPQPSQNSKQIKQQEGQTNSNHSNQVLKSSDILASFGFKNTINFNGQEKKYSVSNLPHVNYNSDLQLTKKLQLQNKVYELDNTDITQNTRNKNSLVEINQQRKTRDLKRTQSFLSFMHKLTGILSSHTRIQGIIFLKRMNVLIKQKNQNVKYLVAILNKQWRKKLQNAFINLKFNSMQHSQVVLVDTQISNSETKIFHKQYTKIDMLAQCNIDIQFSQSDKQAIQRQIPGKDIQILTRTKSDINFNNQHINNQNQEDKKLKMFHFNNQLKRKNLDIFNNYGFDIMKTDVVQKKLPKKNDSGQLSIFSRPNHSVKKQLPFATIQAHHNQNKINKFPTIKIKIKLNQVPINIQFKQFKQQSNKVIKPLLTQNLNLVKEDLPDLCDFSLDNHQLASQLQENINIRSSGGRQSETRKLSFLNPIIKNVDSLIQNKLVQNRFQNHSVSHSIESMKISQGDSEGGQRPLIKKITNQNLVRVKPIQEYQTHKQLKFGRQKTPQKMRISKHSSQRPKSMTIIKFNNYSPCLDQNQNNIITRQNVNHFQLNSKPRPVSNLTYKKQDNPKNRDFIKPSNFLTVKQQEVQNKPRASSGFQVYTYHSSPNLHKNQLRPNAIVTSPQRQSTKVYFTATSPKNSTIQQQQQQLPTGINIYGINNQNNPNTQNVQIQQKVSHHHYLPSPNNNVINNHGNEEKLLQRLSCGNNISSHHTPQKILFKPIQSKRKIAVDKNIQRRNFNGRNTPIKGLDSEEKYNLNAQNFTGSAALKKNKSPSTQKLKIVSNLKKEKKN